ncbi:MAG: hypothetical protein M0Z95_05965 [Actinomycetota bacterium]|nr:hypothetical protein [Actinomycetota bacterium]
MTGPSTNGSRFALWEAEGANPMTRDVAGTPFRSANREHGEQVPPPTAIGSTKVRVT